MGKAESEFQELADGVIAEAEAIDCSLEEFADGLESILHDVKERLSQVRDELREQKADDSDDSDDSDED